MAAIVAYFVFRDQLPSINLDKLVEDLSRSLGSWTYLLVGGLAFLETGAFVGLVAPGEFTVLLGGAVAFQGEISLPVIIAVTWVSAFAGDTVSFLLGAHLGREFLVRHGERFRITPERLQTVERYFARYGGRTILIGRFIGLVRALAPFIAGSSRLPYRNFAPYSILGTGLWSIALILIGYFFARSLNTVTDIVGKGLLVFGIVVGVVVALVVAYRFLREPENRRRVVAEMEKRRALRPLVVLGRRLRPQFAFLGRRLTPGGLGLEFTTLLAVLSVGLFVLIAYWSVVVGDPGPTPGDQTAYDMAHDLQADWLTDVAKVLTTLGSGWVTIPIAVLAAIALAAWRRWMEFWALVIGMTLTVALVPEIKGWTDRPRPPDPARLCRWLGLSQRARRPRDRLHLARGHPRVEGGPGDHAPEPGDRGRHRAHRADRPDARLPAGPLAERCVELRGRSGSPASRPSPSWCLCVAHIRDNPRRHGRAPELDPDAGAGVGD